MRYLKTILSVCVLLMACYSSNAQSPSQGVYGNIESILINDNHLTGGFPPIKLQMGATSNIAYSVDLTRSYKNGVELYPVSMKVGLGYKKNNQYYFFDGSYTITSSNFILSNLTTHKELTAKIDNSKLVVGDKIYLLYENAYTQSGIRTYNNTGYSFIPASDTPTQPGTNPGTNPGTDILYSGPTPVTGSVALYLYIIRGGVKRVFSLGEPIADKIPNYAPNSFIGFVFDSPTEGTVPLYHYLAGNGDNYYTINQTTYYGYTYQGIFCYVYPNEVSKSLPVYEHFNTTHGIHHYRNGPGVLGGWNFEDARFYTLHNSQQSINPLPDEEYAEVYCYYNDYAKDHYYTTVRQNYPGYVYEFVLGYVIRTQRPGTVPLYSYYKSADDHFLTTQKQSYWAYEYEGIVGYVYSSPQPGTIGIYSYYSGYALDHYYITSNTTVPAYDNEGIKFYMMQYNH